MFARVLKADNGESREAALKAAKEVILSGGLVAVPTESFYGLAASVTDEKAIHRLMAAKRRPEDNPILILIPSTDLLKDYVAAIAPVAIKLIKRFWPGGLTMVFEAKTTLPRLLTAGTGKIGVRLSSHPLPTELAR
ncbi:MAG: Sua5/YciO/YrdC/YwlC family protein, partial [Pseudomonadota bacterium]